MTLQFGPILPSMSCAQPASQNSLCIGDTADLWLAQIICLKALFNIQYFNSEMTHLGHCLTIITSWVITFKSAWIFTSLSSKLLSLSHLPNSTSNWEKSYNQAICSVNRSRLIPPPFHLQCWPTLSLQPAVSDLHHIPQAAAEYN